MALLSEDIVEPYRTTLEAGILNAEFSAALLDEAVHLACLADA